MGIANARRGTRLAIMLIESLIGVAAVVAGVLFVMRPSGSLMGMSTSTLAATPFSDYTLPGYVLAIAVGGGTLAAALSVGRGLRNAPELVLLSGVMLVFFELIQEALIGYNPQQAVIAFLGLVLIALSLRLAGPVTEAVVEVKGGSVVVRFPTASALLAFKKPLEFPLTHVIGVERSAAEKREPLGGLFSVMSWLPGVITAGKRRSGTRVFRNFSDPDRAITIFLHDEPYAHVVVDVTDPDEVIATVRKAIPGRVVTAA